MKVAALAFARSVRDEIMFGEVLVSVSILPRFVRNDAAFGTDVLLDHPQQIIGAGPVRMVGADHATTRAARDTNHDGAPLASGSLGPLVSCFSNTD